MSTNFTDQRFAILGAGNMGVALMKGLIEGGVPAPNIGVTNARRTASEKLASMHGVVAGESNSAAVGDADVVFLCIKPQKLDALLADLETTDCEHALFISVIAGVQVQTLQNALGEGVRIVRAMPNTPAMIKLGATAIAPSPTATEDDVTLVKALFDLVGQTTRVEEHQLDAVTGLSGSGPAYVMLFAEALTDAGVKVGLSRAVASQLAIQTIAGSAQWLQQSGEHPARLKDKVTSPGGTTISGLHVLETRGLRGILMDAVEAAAARATELGSSDP